MTTDGSASLTDHSAAERLGDHLIEPEQDSG